MKVRICKETNFEYFSFIIQWSSANSDTAACYMWAVLKLQNFAWADALAALTKLQWKLCNSVPAIEWRPKRRKKKGLRQKIEVFFPRNQVKIKQKKGLHRNLGLYSAGIGRIYSCWLALVRFIIQRSNLDGWTSKSRWGNAKSRWVDVKISMRAR